MAKYSKALVALATAIAVAASEALIPSSYATVALAVLGSLGVYAVPNAADDPSV